MMKPKFASSHDFLSVHHEYFVGTFASILLCPPHFQMSGYATDLLQSLRTRGKDIHYKTQTGTSCEKCNSKAFRLRIEPTSSGLSDQYYSNSFADPTLPKKIPPLSFAFRVRTLSPDSALLSRRITVK